MTKKQMQKEYHENEALVKAFGLPFDEKAYQEYAEKYGPERAQGYRDAMAHAAIELYQSVFRGYPSPKSGVIVHQTDGIGVKNNIIELHAEKVLMLKSIRQNLSSESTYDSPDLTLIPSWL